MALFSTSRDVIALLDQDVSISGGTNSAVQCTSISRGVGIGGCRAEFDMPTKLFDDWKEDLTDAAVTVSVINARDGGGGIDFSGYIDVSTARLSESEDETRVTASTITSYLNKVWIGQEAHTPLKEYWLFDKVTGAPTGLTPAAILRDIFDTLPSYYKARVKLGDVSVLQTSSDNTMPSISFRSQTVAAAMESIMALYGDVTFIERFSGAASYLDFFRIQDSSQPTVSVRVSEWDDPTISGANVDDIDISITSHDVITRVIAYGAPRRYIVTCTNFSESAGALITPGWNPTFEEAVLADPKRAQPNAPGYMPGMELVYKRWLLPAWIQAVKPLKDLGVHRISMTPGTAGATYSPQVWKYPSIMAPDEVNGGIVGTEDTTPVLIKSHKLNLEKGFFELGTCEDGLRMLTYKAGDGATPQTAWNQAKIGITFAFEALDNYLYADTLVDNGANIKLPFASDGLTDQLQRDDLLYVQMTNVGHPIQFQGLPVELACTIFDEDALIWRSYATATVVQDDSKALEKAAKDILRAKNRRHVAANVGLQYFARAYAPGKRLRIDGMRNGIETLMITGVSYDLIDQQTHITADNVKPPHRAHITTHHSPREKQNTPQKSDGDGDNGWMRPTGLHSYENDTRQVMSKGRSAADQIHAERERYGG